MKRTKEIIICTILSISILYNTYSAEVYYLSPQESVSSQINPSYSLSQRIKDILDFSSGRDYSERSGRLSGSFSQEINWQSVSGNKSKSFLEEGTDYLSELNLNLQQKLIKDYNFEGQWFLRKTDNRRIETKKDIRLKQLNIKVFNPKNLFEFGDFYADFSPFVLGSSLEGFNVKLSASELRNYNFIVARKYREDTTTERFQRNVFGFKIDQNLFKDSNLFSNFRVGFQAVSINDDSSTSYDYGNAKDLRNNVFSFDGEISLTKYFSLQYEIARSSYLEDEDSQIIKDTQYGTAFRVQPAINLGKGYLRYLYYYGQPKFYTDLGSASTDKIQHQISLDYRLNEKITINIVENYYWDHLSGSSLTKRTINDEKYLSFNLKPFKKFKNLTLRPYINYQKKNSDDQQNSSEATTKTFGFSINDVLNERTSYGLGYEYRAYRDEGNNKASSDYFHRLNLNFSHEQNFFNKRLFYTISPNLELRNTKTDDDKDINLGLSLNGQYDLLKNTVLRFGHNLQNTNSARVGSDFLNNRSFLEFDFTLYKNKNTHFIFRIERNRYDHEDGAQEYRENRLIAKFLTNF